MRLRLRYRLKLRNRTQRLLSRSDWQQVENRGVWKSVTVFPYNKLLGYDSPGADLDAGGQYRSNVWRSDGVPGF